LASRQQKRPFAQLARSGRRCFDWPLARPAGLAQTAKAPYRPGGVECAVARQGIIEQPQTSKDADFCSIAYISAGWPAVRFGVTASTGRLATPTAGARQCHYEIGRRGLPHRIWNQSRAGEDSFCGRIHVICRHYRDAAFLVRRALKSWQFAAGPGAAKRAD
jgi:hypothetical protein